MWESRVLRRAFERLELHEGKLSRAVLRGGGSGLACDVTAECNDKQQAEPMAQATRGQLDQAGIAPGADEAGERPLIPAALDTGYFSGPAVEALEREGFDPHIATERQRHHSATTPAAAEPASPPATAQAKMQAKLKTAAGRAVDSRRKVIVEP